MAHVAPFKKETVKQFAELMASYPVIGVVDMENLPAAQLQKMREQLRGKVVMRMTKRRLINVAIDEIKGKRQGIEGIKEHLSGMPALLFTKDDPFILAKTLRRSMSPAPAKPGQLALKDIVVPAGPTPFSPGPVISELAAVGIKTMIEAGKIAVKEDAVVVRKGQKVTTAVASILTRLGVTPMEVGLNLTAVYQEGTIFTKDALSIDEAKVMADLKEAYRSSLAFALERAYLTKETVTMLIAKTFREAKAVALSQGFLAEGIAGELMAKAHNEMEALKAALTIEGPQE